MNKRKFIKAGLWRIAGASMLSGLYTWQIRFNVRPEITVFELQKG